MLPVVCLNHLMGLHAHLADVPTLMHRAVLGVGFIKYPIKINSFIARLTMNDKPTDKSHQSGCIKVITKEGICFMEFVGMWLD